MEDKVAGRGRADVEEKDLSLWDPVSLGSPKKANPRDECTLLRWGYIAQVSTMIWTLGSPK